MTALDAATQAHTFD